MKNYYRTVEESAWPKREITSIEEVDNEFDSYGRAFRVTLECGHVCIVTGDAIFNRQHIHCKPCTYVDDGQTVH